MKANSILVFCLSLLLLAGYYPAQAQKLKLDDVMTVEVRGTGPIIKGNEVQGYYMFYQLDRADRKNNNYRIVFLDQNLTKLAQKDFTGSKYLYLQEASFDGEFVMLKFYEAKERLVELRKYDASAVMKSKKVITLNHKREYYQFYTTGESGEVKGEYLFALDEKGFVNYTQRKTKGWGYQIDFIGGMGGGKDWTYNSSEADNDWYTASFIASDGNVLYSLISSRPGAMSRDIEYHILALDAKTGKKIYQSKVNDGKYQSMPMSAYVDNKSGNLVVLGQYMNVDDKSAKDKTLGISSYVFDKSGKLSSTNYISWATDVSKFIPTNEKGKIEDVGFIFFHKIVQTESGEVFAIGEAYKKAASGAGIAITALGGSASLVKMVTTDMYIFKMTSDFKLESVDIFDKYKTDVGLPQGVGLYSAQTLALFIKAYDGFDYSFTLPSKDENVFHVGYTDYEKIKGEKNRTIFGAITYADGKFTTDKIDLSTESTRLFIYPGKPGYILIYEYFRKEKKVDLRLESINF